MARWHSCNVLLADVEPRRLWQFDSRSGQFILDREQKAPADEPLPASRVNKSWRSLWQPRLNIALLPSQSVFLRVVHLPASTPEETLSMVELQLEKLSPIPVTQIVWSFHKLPQSAGDLQTLIVVLAERRAVEDFLGRLEGQGYLADRLELPLLDQLQATSVTEDGAWIYPGAVGGPSSALVAWWYGGALQTIGFITLPASGERAPNLKEQLSHMAWAGELEGWLSAPPAWHLVADEPTAAEWEPPLREGLAEPIRVSPPLDASELATLTANRAANPDTKTSLLPPEFATRYQQAFVDRLWMRGLMAAGGLYLIGVLIYFAAVGVRTYQTNGLEQKVADLRNTYTNAMELKERIQVMTERQDLKFAALDCYKAVAETLPETLTLEGFNFNDGRRLMLNGTAPSDEAARVTDFNDALRRARSKDAALFDSKTAEQPSIRSPNPATVTWNFKLDLKQVEK